MAGKADTRRLGEGELGAQEGARLVRGDGGVPLAALALGLTWGCGDSQAALRPHHEAGPAWVREDP